MKTENEFLISTIFFTKSKVEVKITRKQYRIDALSTLKAEEKLTPSIDKNRNHLVVNPIV